MTNRRYGDHEVREIFSLATTDGASDPPVPAESDGLTLGELQNIAQEAGIDPIRVAHAAASIDARGGPTAVRRMLGLPVGLSRVVDLPQAPTNREWEQLVAEFRTTFGAPGRATSSGGLREWSHGDLHICVEPTERGEQLRLSTLNDTAQGLSVLALAAAGTLLIMSAAVAAAGKPEKALVFLGMFGGIAVTAVGANLMLLPRWARERERQMEAIAEQAIRLLSKPQVHSPPTPGP